MGNNIYFPHEQEFGPLTRLRFLFLKKLLFASCNLHIGIEISSCKRQTSP